jgi:putative ABC transport system permease protein
MIRDIRLACRTLTREPLFALGVITTLTLAIAASTTIFSVAYGVWLKPLPFVHPEQLLTIGSVNNSQNVSSGFASETELSAYQTRVSSFDAVAGYRYLATVSKVGDDPRRIVIYAATANLFSVLEVQPALGRPFVDADQSGSAVPTVILSDGFWRRAWGGDPAVVGKTLQIFGMAARVIGVMPASVQFPDARADAWIPLTPTLRIPDRRQRVYWAIARLKRGTPIDAARAEIVSVSGGLAMSDSATNQGWRAVLTPLSDTVFDGYRTAFGTLVGAVALLLLVCCANVAGLLLARQSSRRATRALYIALGARRLDVIRYALVESIVLAGVAGVLGIAVAWLVTPTLIALLPDSTPRVDQVHLGATALLGAVSLTMFTGILCGIAPALDPVPIRPDLPRQPGKSSRTPPPRFRSALIVAEFALCVSMLIGGGLMLKTFISIVGRDSGFVRTNLWTVHFTVPLLNERDATRYMDAANRATLYHEVLRRLAELPGVQSAAAVTGYPGSPLGYLADATVTAAGSSPSATPAAIRACSEDYFQTMGVPVLAGRVLANQDASEAVVNSTLARKLWPKESPLGKALLVPSLGAAAASADIRYEVVGVVGDMRAGSRTIPEVFVPLSRAPVFWTDLVMRASDESPAVGRAARAVLRDVATDALIEDLLPMRQVFLRQVSLARAQSSIVTVFAVLSMIVAAVGLYSLLSYVVASRTAEFGIRLAIGALPSSIVWSVVRGGVLLAMAGTALGLGCALSIARVLRNQLLGLQRMDPVVLGTAPVVVLILALLAAFTAARRAVGVDVMRALKGE